MEQLFSPWRSQYISSFKEERTGDCVFCKAWNSDQDEANLVVYRGKESFVLMNRFPYNSGHLMVLPIRHTSNFASLTKLETLEMMSLLTVSERVLSELLSAHGFNIGMNLGRPAGAGIDSHLHWHIVPRWNGDTNFMPILADVKVVSEDMAHQWKAFHTAFRERISE